MLHGDSLPVLGLLGGPVGKVQARNIKHVAHRLKTIQALLSQGGQAPFPERDKVMNFAKESLNSNNSDIR